MSKLDTYITKTSIFLPGEAVDNKDIEHVLGYIGEKASRSLRIVLKSNGIKKRHYVLNPPLVWLISTMHKLLQNPSMD